MTRIYDALTYRYPRTLQEAFRCDAIAAVAIERARPSLAQRIYDGFCVGLGVGVVLVGLLSFFDVLVP